MYQPPHFQETRLDVQHELIRLHPFGLLISNGPDGLQANGLPFHLDASASQFGALSTHMARGNDQWRGLDGRDVLIVFQGPQTYISPALYESKKEHGKVVPTWNYATVQARGTARVHDDPAWLMAQINRITNHQELTRDHPWSVADAPLPFIQSQLRGIIGVEIQLATIEGKWKVSQNRPEPDRRGVANGLPASEAGMIELVKTYGGFAGG
jgi:transcriptional regulator